jgi:hypothetical protein
MTPDEYDIELKRVCMNAAQYTPVGKDRKSWGVSWNIVIILQVIAMDALV